MQGKDKLIFDKKFVDQSWSNMERLLDESMPMQADKSESRTLIYILSGLLCLSMLTSMFYAYQLKTQIPQAELTKEKTVYKNIYVEKWLTPEQATIPTVKQSDRSANQQSLKPSLNSYEERSETSLQSAVKQATDQSSTPTTSVTALTDNISTLPTTVNLLEEKEYVESGLYFDESYPELQNASKRPVQYNVGVLLLATTDLDYTGMGLNSTVQIPIGRKLGFKTGLAINYLDRENLFLPDMKRNNDEPTLVDNKKTQTYYEGLKNLKQVYIPLSLNYTLTDSWAINSGFNLRYTYSEEINENLPLPSARPTRAPVADHESIFNNANIGLSAGLQYRLNPHLSLLLDSEWGMSSLINKSQFSNPTQDNYDLNMVNFTTHFTF